MKNTIKYLLSIDWIMSIVQDIIIDNIEVNGNDHALGCGLEDRGITDKYEAMSYGFDEGVEQTIESIKHIVI